MRCTSVHTRLFSASHSLRSLRENRTVLLGEPKPRLDCHLQPAIYAAMDFKVEIDTYSGPLDLLLHLIRRTEVDIWAVSVATIAEQFLQQVETLQEEGRLALEDAGEFVVLAATLLELKSEMLLPALQDDDNDAESDDPRFGLVRQLIEFKRYRDLSQVLEQQRQRQARCAPRPDGLVPEVEAADDVFLDDVTALDLYRSFSSLVLETKLDLRTIVFDDRPIEEVIEELRGRLPLGQWLALRELLEAEDEHARSSLISLFLATLELTRQQECEIDQRDGDVYLRRVEKEAGDTTAAEPTEESS